MQTLAATRYGQADPFTPTQWSVVLAAGETQADPESSRAALAQLCQTYWAPLYAYVRAQGYAGHDAQDLTQGFFAHFVQHRIYARTDRQKGKFRSFLLASLKNFLRDAHDREQASKRGGGQVFVPLDDELAEAAELLFRTHAPAAPGASGEDQLYERTWAETLLSSALDALAETYKARGRESLFREIAIYLTIGAAPLPGYAEVAARLAVSEATLRSHVARLRARYRELLRAEVRRTVASEAEVDEELRELLRVLTSTPRGDD